MESRLPVGSSANTTAGRAISARAIATRCCWPPDSSAGRCVRRSPRPTASTTVSNHSSSIGGAGERQRERDVLPRGQHRDEVVRLEDEAELVAPERREPLVVEVGQLLAGDDDRAGRRAVESGEQVHQRGLAGPGGPHDRGELAGGELEADAPQRVDRGLPLPVGAVQLCGGDDRSGHGSRGHAESIVVHAWAIKEETRPRAGAGSRTTRPAGRRARPGPAGGPPPSATGRAWRRSTSRASRPRAR